jgi:transcriptional regulator with XRE-family HTH domain
MPVQISPTVKRRRLAAELRHHREQSGLTIEEVAERLEWSNAKISRIENARVSVLPRDVKFLLGVYGVGDGDERDALLSLSRASRQRGWWRQFGDVIPDWFEVYVGLEGEASTLRNYECEFVPGLLQTENYARAVHRATIAAAADGGVDRQVALRMARQERLRTTEGPRLWVVMNEAVIRRVVGGRAVMRAQLAHLAGACGRPNVTLQVLPFSAGAHPSMNGAFIIMDFPEPTDPDVVYVEYHSGTLYLEKAAEVKRYRLIFDHLRAEALPADESRALITTVAKEFG